MHGGSEGQSLSGTNLMGGNTKRSETGVWKNKFSFGENTGMQGVLGVTNTGVGQQTGANMFGYFTTSQLHKAVKAFLSS